MSFHDVAGELGIRRVNVCGSYENPYILESLGSGIDRRDAATWTNDRWPGQGETGMAEGEVRLPVSSRQKQT